MPAAFRETGRAWAQSGRILPRRAEAIRPSSMGTREAGPGKPDGQMSPVFLGRHRPMLGLSSARFSPGSTNFGLSSTKFHQQLPGIDKQRPGIGQIRPKLGQILPEFKKRSAEIGQLRLNRNGIDEKWPEFGQAGFEVNSAQFGRESVNSGRKRPYSVRHRPNSTNVQKIHLKIMNFTQPAQLDQSLARFRADLGCPLDGRCRWACFASSRLLESGGASATPQVVGASSVGVRARGPVSQHVRHRRSRFRWLRRMTWVARDEGEAWSCELRARIVEPR